MKIEQFEDYIHDDLAWRKMEISQLFRIFNDAESKEVVTKSIGAFIVCSLGRFS